VTGRRPASTGFLVLDMLNPYEHRDAEPLADSVAQALPAIAAMLARARGNGLPVIYVNDNHGDWSACRDELVEKALAGHHPELVEGIAPEPDDAFLTKARHSAFYETQLEYLLRDAAIDRVVLLGQVTEQCVLYSALDAYVRKLSIAVPHDAVAHIHEDLGDAALRMMSLNMGAEVTSARRLRPA
jgi:nicotinamidase-related amidase